MRWNRAGLMGASIFLALAVGTPVVQAKPGPFVAGATIPIPAWATATAISFDISWVNQDTQEYFLADRTPGVPGAGGGLEQPVWYHGRVYISVPEFNGADGGVAVIDPDALQVTGTFPAPGCGPTGLVLGIGHRLVTGCGSGGSFVINLENGHSEHIGGL